MPDAINSAAAPALRPVLPGTSSIAMGEPVTTSRHAPSFSDALKNFVSDVSRAQDKSDDAIRRYVSGEPIEIHEVMAAAEEAGLTLELLVALKDKFTDALRQLSQMQ